MRSWGYRTAFLALFLISSQHLLSPGTAGATTATVTATGHFSYTEQLSNGGTRDVPIKGARVRMCDNDGAGGCEAMGEGVTDDNGYFQVTGTGGDWDSWCVGNLGCGLPDPLVTVEADSNFAVVKKPLATLDPTAPTYCFKSYSKINVGTGTVDFGTITPGSGLKCGPEPHSAAGEDGAWHLFAKLEEAHAAVTSQLWFANLPKVTAFWPDWDGQNFYRPPVLFDGGAISIEAGSVWNEAAIGHEYGHHAVTSYTNSGLDLWTFPALYLNGRCDPGHCTWEPENDPIAYFEGWAHFVSAVIGRYYNYDDQVDWGTHADLGFPGQEDHIEGFNAAILWDLYGTMSGHCLQGAMQGWWVTRVPPTSIHEYWNDLSSCDCGVRTNWASEIYREHHIIKPQADLVAALLSQPPASGVQGETFSASVTVSNAGDEATRPDFVTCPYPWWVDVASRSYLSLDTIVDAADRKAGEYLVPPLAAGAGHSRQTSVTIPGDLAPGSYHLIVCADAAGALPESDETNNCAVSAATIQVTAAVARVCFTDTDGDGYQAFAPDYAAWDCGILPSWNRDCDDTNGAVHPGAAEVCDGLSNDCDSEVDEGVTTAYFRDADADGFGDPNAPVQACSAPAGYVAANTDCNDASASMRPGNLETCDGVDNNCSGQVDEGVATAFYHDADGDGYGNLNSVTQACAQPAGYTQDSTDCNDLAAAVYPGATELCNSGDDDCDGQVNEGGVCTGFTCGGKTATIVGTGGNDRLVGTAGDDVILGQGGNDTIAGLGGNDTLCGGAGNDLLDGGSGRDRIDGGPGIDTVSYAGSPAGVVVNLTTGTGTGQGNDTLVQGTIEGLVGSKYNDRLTGNAGANALKGGAGNDVLLGLGGGDVLNGGSGTDTCDGGVDATRDSALGCETTLRVP